MCAGVTRFLVAAFLLTTLLWPQTPAANSEALRFEVATIKPSQGGRVGGIRPAPGGQRYVGSNVPLRLVIQVAYRLRNDQVIGGPGWIDTDRWDINAQAERPSTTEQLHIMLRNLLADRFELQFHRDTKERSIYALTVDKDGPRLTPHQQQSAGDPWIDVAQEQPFHMKWSAKSVPMDYVAWRLGLALDRPVIDRTELKGGYDFELSYTAQPPPEIPAGALLNGQPIDTSGPTVFEALRRQLGLKLESEKGPVEILIIDRAEKPAGN